MVGQCTAEGLGDWLYKTSTQASSNYGIDRDGRIGMYVEEKNRSWCISSNADEVWPHEALDFTPWLSQDDNISLLADAIGLDITVDETESSVGDFNVDIFASETGTDRKIIIENQSEIVAYDLSGGELLMVAEVYVNSYGDESEFGEEPVPNKGLAATEETDPTNMGTYNYCGRYIEYGAISPAGVYHWIFDMLPYDKYGNTSPDDKPIEEYSSGENGDRYKESDAAQAARSEFEKDWQGNK